MYLELKWHTYHEKSMAQTWPRRLYISLSFKIVTFEPFSCLVWDTPPPKSALLANNSVQHWVACICNMRFGEKCCQAMGLDMMIFVLFVANFSILHFSTISTKGTGASTAKIRPHTCHPHAVLPKMLVICLISDPYIWILWNLHYHLSTLNLSATTNTLILLWFALEPG